jgi:hypothetical protein
MQQVNALITDLWNRNEKVSAITILASSNHAIIYQTNNWDLTPDIGKILNTWTNQGGAIEVQGIRYSMLQCTPERLICRNVGGQGAIIASKEGNIIGVAYLLPDADLGGAYVDVARCVTTINKEIGKNY